MNVVDVWPEHECARDIAKHLQHVLDCFAIDEAEVSVRLTDDEEIRELNRTYRHKDKSTDVLSFPQPNELNLPEQHLGDIVISLDTASVQAEEHEHDLHTELLILARHGLLHLLGYDHDGDDPQAWDEAEELVRRQLSET